MKEKKLKKLNMITVFSAAGSLESLLFAWNCSYIFGLLLSVFCRIVFMSLGSPSLLLAYNQNKKEEHTIINDNFTHTWRVVQTNIIPFHTPLQSFHPRYFERIPLTPKNANNINLKTQATFPRMVMVMLGNPENDNGCKLP